MEVNKSQSAVSIEPVKVKSIYPEPFASMMGGRIKRKLGDSFGLTNFGVNLTDLEPGAISALKHHHLIQDEFIYVIYGMPTLNLGDEKIALKPGDCYGFKGGSRVAHHLANETNDLVRYLEIGDRSKGDEVEYPEEDLCAKLSEDGRWEFLHKDGRPY